jgi:hypothetical protein
VIEARIQRLDRTAVAGEARGVSRAARILLPLLAVSSAAIAQEPALGRFFRTDDFVHLYEIVEHGWLQSALTTNGGHLSITSNTAFYLCHALFGLNAGMFFAVAWLTHLLNVYLLYRVVEISTDRQVLAFIPALLWGVSGLAQEPLGWFAVYGHVLLATWILWFLAEVAEVSRGRRELGAWTLARWVLLLLLGATSFGTGIPIAMLSGPVVLLLLAGSSERRRSALWLSSLVVLVPVLYFATFWIYYSILSPGSQPELRDPPLVGSLRPSNWWPTFSLLGMLLAYGVANLLLGPLVTATEAGIALGPLAGASLHAVAAGCAVFSAAVLAACAVALRRASSDARRRIAGYGVLAVGAYGMVALARASFFGFLNVSLTLPMVQPRYHYMAQALTAIFLTLAAAQLPLPRFRPSGWRWGAVVAAALLVVALGRSSSLVVYEMMGPDGRVPFERTVAEIEDAVASSPPGSEVRIENRPFEGGGFLSGPFLAGTAAVFVIAFPSNEVDGRRVYFVERDPERRQAWVDRIPGTRLSRLLVAPNPRGS